MQKELEFNTGGCKNCRNLSQNDFCTFIALDCKYPEKSISCLPELFESQHLTETFALITL
jgi:hypothetical protein